MVAFARGAGVVAYLLVGGFAGEAGVLAALSLGDQDAIEYMCREAIPAIIELEHYGVPF